MFILLSSTEDSPSSNKLGGFRLLFLLYSCTAFLTLINGSTKDSNDTEAIIQLSADSIHVVKASDPRISIIEESVGDQQEKELLISLITALDLPNSSDDVNKKSKTLKLPRTSGIKVSPNVLFIPPSLNFNEQPIAIPTMLSFSIVNDGSEPLEIYSLSGTNTEFYSSFTQQTILSATGGNVSINIYYLPRTIGQKNKTLTIETSRGNFSYQIDGRGVFNPFRVHPLINILIPFNSTYEQLVHVFNPFNHSLDINEIFTSDEHLIIELLSTKNSKNKISKAFQYNEQWHLEPYETKPVIKLNYIAHRLGLIHGFVCIKTDHNHTLILSVEINVSNRSGLYPPNDVFSFNADRLISSTSEPIKAPLFTVNYGSEPVIITDVQIGRAREDYISIHWKNIQVPADPNRLNKVADVVIDPKKILEDIVEIDDVIHVAYYSFSEQKRRVLKIRIYTRLIHGSIGYLKNDVMLYRPPSNSSYSFVPSNQCHRIRLINRFSTTVVLFKVTTKFNSILSNHVHVNLTSNSIELKSNQSTEALCVTTKPSSSSIKPFETINGLIEIHTNLSSVFLPFYIYDGFITLSLPTDRTNDGIQWYQSSRLEVFVSTIPFDQSRTVIFYLINTNPVDIQLKRLESTINNGTIEFDSFEPLMSGTMPKHNDLFNSSLTLNQIIIPANHRVVFKLRIMGIGPIGFYTESLFIETMYQKIHSLIHYSISSGSIELSNNQSIHFDVLMNQVGAAEISVKNHFNRSINVTSINLMSFGKCFSMSWINESFNRVTIEPNRTQSLGILKFTTLPICNETDETSSFSHYCAVAKHPEFKENWNDYISILNSDTINADILADYREFSHEWMTLIERLRLTTLIWLGTSQANISWPVTIDFHWPSVLEFMPATDSRAKLILDFDIVPLNVTKNQSLLISNPSADLVQYSIEMFTMKKYSESDSDIGSEPLDQVFSLSTVSEHVKLVNNVYVFELQPNERMIFTVSYRSNSIEKHDSVLLIRNNLTMLETIWLYGEGGTGSLTIGDLRSNSMDDYVIFEMDSRHAELCNNVIGNIRIMKILSVVNVGNLEATIEDVSFGNMKCFGNGFMVENCTGILIKPQEKYQLKIMYQPDYALDEIHEILTLNTNMGRMQFPMVVRIPQNVISACGKTIPRPIWEFRSYCLCLCTLVVCIVLILGTAFYDARRLYDDYLNRAELRDQIQTNNNSFFNLKDLSLAAQDSRSENIGTERLVKSVLQKKAKSIDLTSRDEKTNNSDRIAKDSLTTSGIESSNTSKIMRSTDSLDKVIDSNTETNLKIPRNKARRSTTDNGQPKVAQEIASKNTSNSRPDSAKSSSKTNATKVRAPTPPQALSSSALSDDDNEPFRVARPRRASVKVKEPSTLPPQKQLSTVTDADPNSIPSSVQMKNSSPKLEPPEQRNQQEASPKGEKTNGVKRKISVQPIPSFNTYKEQPSKNETRNMNGKADLTSSTSQNATNSVRPLSRIRSNRNDTPKRTRRSRPSRNSTHQSSDNKQIPYLRVKRNSVEFNQPNFASENEQLLFAQLVEQLKAAGFATSRTSCSMSIRSRCSSAPPSEHGGIADLHGDDNEIEEIIDWDDPQRPDDDFSLYANQTEQFLTSSNVMNDRTINEEVTAEKDDKNNNESPISTSTGSKRTNNFTPLTFTLSDPIQRKAVEPASSLQLAPGPIQRPSKLPWSTIPSTSAQFNTASIQSPNTPDVLVQINHILQHQNSIPGLPMTPSANNSDTLSGATSEISTPNVSWTPFSPNDWSLKYDGSWPVSNTPNGDMVLRVPSQSPFVQKPIAHEPMVWPTALGTETPRPVSKNPATHEASLWNEDFPTSTSASTDVTKVFNNLPQKLWSTQQQPSSQLQNANWQESESNKMFWDASNLNDSQSGNMASWWSKPASNQNDDKDHSRWDFAR